MPTGGETSSGGKGNRKGKRKNRNAWDDGFNRPKNLQRNRAMARADQRAPLDVLQAFPSWALRKELRRRAGGADTDMGVRTKGRKRYLFGRGPKTGLYPSKKWAMKQAAGLYPVAAVDTAGQTSVDSVVNAAPGSDMLFGRGPRASMWPSKKWVARQASGLSAVPVELAGVSAYDTFR